MHPPVPCQALKNPGIESKSSSFLLLSHQQALPLPLLLPACLVLKNASMKMDQVWKVAFQNVQSQLQLRPQVKVLILYILIFNNSNIFTLAEPQKMGRLQKFEMDILTADQKRRYEEMFANGEDDKQDVNFQAWLLYKKEDMKEDEKQDRREERREDRREERKEERKEARKEAN